MHKKRKKVIKKKLQHDILISHKNKEGVKLIQMILLAIIVLEIIFIGSDGSFTGNPILRTTYCCERAIDGAWCQDVNNVSQCDDQYNIVPTSCEFTSFCELGCCYDNQEGICYANSPKAVCESSGRVWNSNEDCEISLCALGCCTLGNQTIMITQSRCELLASQQGVGFNWNEGDCSSFEEMQLSSGSQNQINPDIYENKVVWQGYDNGVWHIFLQDVLSGETTQLSDSNYSYDNKNPKIYGNKVVWFKEGSVSPYRGDLVVYDLLTGQREDVLNMYFYAPLGDWLDFYENKVVYSGYVSSPDRNNIFIFNLNTKQITQVTNNLDTSDNDPYFKGNKLAFVRKNLGGYYDVYVKDLGTGVETKLIDSTSNQLWPVVEGDLAVWSGLWTSQTNNDIFMRDLSGSSNWEWVVHSDLAAQDPDIDSKRLVWQGQKDGSNWEIFKCDLRMNGLNGGCLRDDQKIVLTNNPAEQANPSIYKNKVVWQDFRNGNWDIYFLEFPITCRDGTLAGECSSYNYCDFDGELKGWCWKCGCPPGQTCDKVGATRKCSGSISGVPMTPSRPSV